MIADHYSDDGILLMRVFAKKGIPPLITGAADLTKVAHKHPEDYAVAATTDAGPEFRLPLHDAGNALASAVYFAEYQHQLEPELRKEASAKLCAALLAFGLPVPEGFEKTASMELGFSDPADDMALERLFAVDDPQSEWEQVEDAFAGFSPRGKRRLVMQLKDQGADVEKHAGLEMRAYLSSTLAPHAEVKLNARRMLLKDPAAGEQLDGLMHKVASARRAGDYVDVDALAEEVYQFDQDNNLTGSYGRLISDPWVVLLENPPAELTKTASVKVGSQEISDEQLRALATSPRVRATFGDALAEGLSSDPVGVFDSLPDPHKQALAGMLDEHSA